MHAAEKNTREKILLTALELFAVHGFEGTSVRQIAKQAMVNISAISYYFGDKAGLYKAAFVEPLGSPKDDIAYFNPPELSLEEALSNLFTRFTEPLQNELSRMAVRLHMREMVEPTGLWQEEIDNGITPYHQALLVLLQRNLGLNTIDDDLHRLAICIVAMGVHLFAGRDVIEKICPQITQDKAALIIMQQRLTMFAMSMVEAEALRRKALYI